MSSKATKDQDVAVKHSVHGTKVEKLKFRNQLAKPTIDTSAAGSPRVMLEGHTRNPRITTSIAFMLAAELERRSPESARWVVSVGRTATGAAVWLELFTGEAAEREAGLALLELTVAEAL